MKKAPYLFLCSLFVCPFIRPCTYVHPSVHPSLHPKWSLQAVKLYSQFHFTRDEELSNFITCPRTNKWLESTCPTKIYLPKIDIFFLFLAENICCGYSLEVPHWGTSNEYPQCMFSSRIKKKYLSYNLDTLLLELWITCPRISKLKFLICPQGNGTSWTSQAWYFHSSDFTVSLS